MAFKFLKISYLIVLTHFKIDLYIYLKTLMAQEKKVNYYAEHMKACLFCEFERKYIY